MMREMEQEMNSLSRAFGMPALRTWEVDLPSAVPAAAHVLACDVQVCGGSKRSEQPHRLGATMLPNAPAWGPPT